MLAQEKLKEVLSYDKDTGVWVWKAKTCCKVVPGKKAGSINADGYLVISIYGKDYYAHRLAFLYMLGEMPSMQVDHINLDKSDCRWENLREATHSQNKANTGLRPENKTGVIGVSINNKGKFVVRVGQRYVGIRNTLAEAKSLRQQAAKAAYGTFAR
jgi:hypothetical protein